MLVNKELIARILAAFLVIAQKDSVKYDPRDVQLVKTNEWWVERFALATESEADAVKVLSKSLEWRKAFGVNDLNEKSFTPELNKLDFITNNIKDREGRPVLWLIMSFSSRPETKDVIKQYSVWQMEKIDKQTTHEGWVLIADFTQADQTNIDLPWFMYLVELFQWSYPKAIKQAVLIDVPEVMKASIQMVLSVTYKQLKEKIVLIGKDQLANYIDAILIPEHLRIASNQTVAG